MLPGPDDEPGMMVHSRYISALLTGAMCFILMVMKPGVLRADEVVLGNGDKLSGKIISNKDGVLLFESEMLGQISIEMSKVKSLKADQPTAIKGQPKPDNQPKAAPAAGGQPKAASAVGDKAKTGAAAGGQVKKEEAAKGVKAAEAVKMKWNGDVSVGFTGRQGNISRDALASSLKVKGVDALWTINGFFQNRYAEQEVRRQRVRTDNEVRGGARVSREINKTFLWFVETEMEQDEKEQLSFRSLSNGGLGINWIKNKSLEYQNRFGTGYQYESFEDDSYYSSQIGDLASDLTFRINDRVELLQETVWMPDFSNQEAYRITAESAVAVYFDKTRHFFVKAGIQHDYDNQPNKNKVEQLDVYYFSQFGYSF